MSLRTVFVSTANYYSKSYFIAVQLDYPLNLDANHFTDSPIHSGNHCILSASSHKLLSLSWASKAYKNVSGLVLPLNLEKFCRDGVGICLACPSKLFLTSCSASLIYESWSICIPPALTCCAIYLWAVVRRAMASAASFAICAWT